MYATPNRHATAFTIVTVRTNEQLHAIISRMDWYQIIQDLQDRQVTLQEIADKCGFASRGAVHDLKNVEKATCSYERGAKLVALHKRAMRRPYQAKES